MDENFFSILNDDCIFQILEQLSLTDLCQCSRTCQRLQALCETQFVRKHTEASEEVRIRIGYDGRIHTRLFEHVKCFYNFVKTIKINLWPFEQETLKNGPLDLAPVIDFMKTKCDENLHKITIVGDINLVALVNGIEKFLPNVQIVGFIGRTKCGQDEATFLTHCPNVKKIVLCSLIAENHATENIDAILKHEYDHLNHLHFIYCDALSINPEKLKMFFGKHNKIESVAMTFGVTVKEDDPIRDASTIKCIQSIDYATNLRTLFLSVTEPLTKCFGNICSYLDVLCDRDNFKYLEFEFLLEAGANLLKSHEAQLANWQQLTKIHLKFIPLKEVLTALRRLVHLKTIVLLNPCLQYNSFVWSNLGQAMGHLSPDMTLPQIEEFQLESRGGYDDDILYYVERFVRHWKTLKRIVMPTSKSKLELDKLNDSRNLLADACELTILTNHEKNETNFDYNLVKLKCVRFESDCGESPFQQYTIAL